MKKITRFILLVVTLFFSITNFAQTVCTDYTINPATVISASGNNTWATSTINVPDAFTISDINVTINVSHTRVSDLRIFLSSPGQNGQAGQMIRLSDRNGGNGSNYTTTTFDDAAPTSITAGAAPFNGTYSPEVALSTLNGTRSNGLWGFFINDVRNGNGGIINSVTLTICYTLPTGPGGVGTTDGAGNLVLWLNAENTGNTATNWLDQSGYGSNFSAGTGATLNSDNVNNFDSYNFNGSSNYFQRAFTTNLNPNSYSIFSTSRVTSSNEHKAVYSNRDDSGARGFILYSVPYSNNWEFWTGSSGWSSANSSFSTISSWASQFIRFDNINNGKQIYINNNLRGADTDNMVRNTVRPFRIGAGANEKVSPSYYFNGDISEIIMYNIAISNVERIIVNNYLAAKYNYTITDDFYTQDNSTNGDFDFNVAGIGQATDGSIHNDSQGTGIIRMNTPSSLGNDEYLLWGEEVRTPTYNFTTDTSTYLERLNSKWRVSKRNDLGTVSVHVRTSDIMFNTPPDGCNSLNLIVSSSSTFATKTTYSLTLNNGIGTATNVAFTDGDYFTFEYLDSIVIDNTKAYNGSGTSNVPDTTDGCYKLLVKGNANGTISLTEDATVREIEIEAGGKLIVTTGKYLQVKNGINNAGDIRLIGNSQLLQDHTGVSQVTGTGNLYMDQKSTNTNVYQSGYWTSPVTTNGTTFTIKGVLKDGATPTSVSSTSTDIDFTDAGILDGDASSSPVKISGRWLAKLINNTDWTRQINPETVTFTPGEGWNMKGVGANFTFKGIPNDGDYSTSIDKDRLSLLGNPYPSALDAHEFIKANNGDAPANNNSFTGTLYFYGNEETTHLRATQDIGYATKTLIGATADARGNSPSQYIAVGQGFFVTRSTAGTGTINFTNSQRVFKTLGGGNQLFGEIENRKPATISKIKIGFEYKTDSETISHRQILVGFAGLTTKYENGYDGEMFDRKPTDIALSMTDKVGDFVISGIQNFNKDIEIPLSVYADKTRDVTFKIDQLENITTNVYLKDAVKNQVYNLTNTPVSLNIDTGTYTDRFFITFKQETLDVTKEIYEKDLLVFYHKEQQTLHVKSPTNLLVQTIEMYTILGQKIGVWKNNTSKNQEFTIPIKNISTALYIVKVKTNKGLVSKKIIISD